MTNNIVEYFNGKLLRGETWQDFSCGRDVYFLLFSLLTIWRQFHFESFPLVLNNFLGDILSQL